MKIMLAVTAALILAACESNTYDTRRTTYGAGGQATTATIESGGQIISELRREFESQTVTGQGAFTNRNEALARRAATQLAVAEMAAKVETAVQGNTRIYNNSDIRDVVETQVNALVQNYEITSEFYDRDTGMYEIEVAVTGEKIVEEFERQLRR